MTVLAEARAAKMLLRQRSAACRAIRKRWYELRAATSAGVEIGHEPQLLAIGDLTAELWAAETALSEAAAGWRAVLATRESVPPAERWNLIEMERWAAAQPLV